MQYCYLACLNQPSNPSVQKHYLADAITQPYPHISLYVPMRAMYVVLVMIAMRVPCNFRCTQNNVANELLLPGEGIIGKYDLCNMSATLGKPLKLWNI